MNKSELHSGHRDRLRKKFADFGADALLDHELLELALFYPIPRINTNGIAHGLIKDFKNISGILNAPTSELIKSKGIGENSAEFIRLLADICQEYSTFSEMPHSDATRDDLCRYFREYFLNASSGVCLLLCIDYKLQVKNKISFTAKNILKDDSEIRRIIQFLIAHDCSRTVLGINHSQGGAIPNNMDFAVLRALAEKFSILNIILADCIICSGDRTFSLRQHGAFSFEE